MGVYMEAIRLSVDDAIDLLTLRRTIYEHGDDIIGGMRETVHSPSRAHRKRVVLDFGKFLGMPEEIRATNEALASITLETFQRNEEYCPRLLTDLRVFFSPVVSLNEIVVHIRD